MSEKDVWYVVEHGEEWSERHDDYLPFTLVYPESYGSCEEASEVVRECYEDVQRALEDDPAHWLTRCHSFEVWDQAEVLRWERL